MMRRNKGLARAGRLTLLSALFAAGTASGLAQSTPAGAPREALEVIEVRPNFHVIAGAGAHVAVQTGPDGAIVVDSGAGDRTADVVTEIRRITREPIRYLISTSHNVQHVGGNDALSAAGRSVIPTGGLNEIGAAGGRAPIVAEEHVQAAMTAPTGETPKFPVGAWPTVTFSAELGETQKDLYFNGEAILVTYQRAAHSDGDSVVFFRRSDVIVAGEVFDTTRFPVVDLASGGSVQGIIDALNRIIVVAVAPVPLTWQDGGTVIVPARGPLAHEADVVDYRDMLTIVRDRVQDLLKKGLSLEQVLKADPVKGYRRRYGADSGPWTTQMFVEAAYRSLGGK